MRGPEAGRAEASEAEGLGATLEPQKSRGFRTLKLEYAVIGEKLCFGPLSQTFGGPKPNGPCGSYALCYLCLVLAVSVSMPT